MEVSTPRVRHGGTGNQAAVTVDDRRSSGGDSASCGSLGIADAGGQLRRGAWDWERRHRAHRAAGHAGRVPAHILACHGGQCRGSYPVAFEGSGVPTNITCTRRLTFEAGHRVYGHESKCANVHGHSYKAEIEASAELDQLGRVIDFSVLKERIGGWLDSNLDHAFIAWGNDPLVDQLPQTKLYVMPTNPTAENIAGHLLDVCPVLLEGTGVTVTRVVIHETENCKAEARL